LPRSGEGGSNAPAFLAAAARDGIPPCFRRARESQPSGSELSDSSAACRRRRRHTTCHCHCHCHCHRAHLTAAWTWTENPHPFEGRGRAWDGRLSHGMTLRRCRRRRRRRRRSDHHLGPNIRSDHPSSSRITRRSLPPTTKYQAPRAGGAAACVLSWVGTIQENRRRERTLGPIIGDGRRRGPSRS
jgi:hypothetical protein